MYQLEPLNPQPNKLFTVYPKAQSLLFIIYINDLPQISEIAKFIMYADDANIFLTGENINKVYDKLKILSDVLVKWEDNNGLALNLKKRII